MADNAGMAKRVEIVPVTEDRWEGFERLFGRGGGYGGCWCMYFRLSAKDNERAKPAERKAGMRALVDSGDEPGLLAYVDGEPAGWVSLAPRERFERLERSRVFRRVDDEPVWTVVCFVIGKGYRRQGLSGKLLAAAVKHAKAHGARFVEAYPYENTEELTGYQGYMGVRSVFERAGFAEVGRTSHGRAIMRRRV